MFHFRFSHDTPRAVPALVRCDGPVRASRGDNKCQMNPAAAIEVQCPTEDLDLRRTNPNDASEATPRISGHAHCHRHPTRLDHFRHRTVEHQIIRGNTNNLTGEGRCGGPPRSRTTEDHGSDVSPERWDTAATAIETQRHRSGISPFDGPFEGDTLFESAVGTITDAIDALTIERAIDPTSTGPSTRPAMAAEDWAGVQTIFCGRRRQISTAISVATVTSVDSNRSSVSQSKRARSMSPWNCGGHAVMGA